MSKEVKEYTLRSGEVYFEPFPPEPRNERLIQKARNLLRWWFRKAPIRREYFMGYNTEFTLKVINDDTESDSRP